MSGGGTYALISGSRVQTTFRAAVKLIASKLVRSGPLVAFAVMVVLSLFSLKLPQGVVEIAKIGAAANAFLCMIMIGESIDLSMTLKKVSDRRAHCGFAHYPLHCLGLVCLPLHSGRRRGTKGACFNVSCAHARNESYLHGKPGARPRDGGKLKFRVCRGFDCLDVGGSDDHVGGQQKREQLRYERSRSPPLKPLSGRCSRLHLQRAA